MNLESRKVPTQKNPEELYTFLTNVANFKELMPDDTKFELRGDDSFLFGLKGMPEIKLQLKEQTPYSKVVLGSASDKFDFSLICDIEDKEAGSEAQLFFTGDFNPMMAMMIKGPIKKFLEQLAKGLEQF
ncbi:orotate phosphoribosyltransferase [Nonlabens tegetincola]|uniref:orotate phosphoribosyltransferase n=1 Tax=Nonlabens tegetincola TaxID=323273 RepID=UPI000A2076F1|nr:orotate phosphoribosyltransferase [Nonlabens tegetincola]ARN70453.1 orotate phosphoribosyltransferase [Nonlabens tegetincola]